MGELAYCGILTGDMFSGLFLLVGTTSEYQGCFFNYLTANLHFHIFYAHQLQINSAFLLSENVIFGGGGGFILRIFFLDIEF